MQCSEHKNSDGLTLSQAALELVWPTRCAGCEKRGVLLCEDCDARLVGIERQYSCPFCGAPYGHITCTECYSSRGKEAHVFSAAVSVAEMDELSGRIVVLYKDKNEQRLSHTIATKLARHLPALWVSWADAIAWVPADKRALKRRGFDHMQRIALALSELLHVPAYDLLAKQPGKDQRGLNREERAANLCELFSVRLPDEPMPHNVLLIDDVHTTGASLNAAAQTLLEAGVRDVRVASFVRVW